MNSETNESAERLEELEIAQAIEQWSKQLGQVKRLLIPVTFNMMLTLCIWIGVYETKTDPNSVFYYMLDPGHNRSTGNEIIDGMVNGIGCVFMLALISFALLAMALNDYKRLVQLWLYMSCVLIIFGVFASFLIDLFKAFGFETAPPVATTVIVLTYGTIGILVFFTKCAPLCMHQFYVICNCSLVSVFYLRMFPTHTAWFVLLCIILWDTFAVLAPIGPLRRINEKAHEYSDQVLRFLMFTAEDTTNAVNLEPIEQFENDSVKVKLKKKSKNSDSESDSTSDYNRNSKMKRSEHSSTVYDALNDGSSIRLGMGDFVFYGLLVGKAAATHSVLCTVGAALGILVGLMLTLTLLSSEDETTPALPVSVAIGLIMHFGIHHWMEPMMATMRTKNFPNFI